MYLLFKTQDVNSDNEQFEQNENFQELQELLQKEEKTINSLYISLKK